MPCNSCFILLLLLNYPVLLVDGQTVAEPDWPSFAHAHCATMTSAAQKRCLSSLSDVLMPFLDHNDVGQAGHGIPACELDTPDWIRPNQF